MRAFWKLLVAEIKEFIRDRMAIFWLLAFPVFFILLFGTVFSSDEGINFDVGLVVEDSGPAGMGLAQGFKQIPVFTIKEGSRDEMLEALQKGKCRAVIVLPEGLTQAIAAKKTVDIPVYYDPSNQNTAQAVLSIIRQVLDEVDRRVSGTPRLLTMSEQTMQSHRLRNIDYLLPGILAMALMQLGIFGTAQPLISLRQRQILRRLSATPLSRLTLLSSHVIMRLLTAITQTLLILGTGMLVFKVQVMGSWWLVAGFVFLGGLAFIAIGYLVAAISRTEEAGIAFAQFLNFIMMFLSGIFFPVDLMPGWLKPIIQAIPLTYLGDALRQTMVKATALYPLRVDAAVLGGWLLVCVVLSVRFFKWETQ